MKRYLCCAFWALIGSGQLLLAQSFAFRHYAQDDGLPSSEVHDVFQDQRGYIWLATDHGLCRFNGQEFRVFTDEDGLTDNTIFDIVEDSQGHLWFTTYEGGICYYDFEKFAPHPANEQILDRLERFYVDNLVIDSNDVMWMSLSFSSLVEKSIFKIDSTQQLQSAAEKDRLPRRHDLSEEHKNILQEQVERHLQGILNGRSIYEKNRNYLQRSNGNHLIAIGNYLFELNPEKRIFRERFMPGMVLALLEDHDHHLWVGLDRGQGAYFFENETILSHPQVSLEGKSVTDIMLDLESNFWFSTIEDGVYFMPNKSIRVLDLPGEVPPKRITSLELFNDLLWIGTYLGNLYALNQKLEFVLDGIDVGPNYDMLNYNDQFLMLSSKDLVFPDLRIIHNFFVNSISIRALELGPGGVVFQGGMRGLAYSSLEEMQRNTTFLFSNFKTVYALKKDSRNRLWIGALSGLYCLENKALHTLSDAFPLLGTRVTDIEVLGPDTLLVATKGAGVLIWTGDTLHQLTTHDGLNSNFIRDVFIQDHQTFWIASNKGLNRASRADGSLHWTLEGFTTKSGLPSNEVNKISFYNNFLWLATSQGVCYLAPQNLHTNRTPPNVLITQIRIKGQPVHGNTSLDLSARENDVAILYKGLSYRNNAAIQYRFKLEGYDKNWITTKQHLANYTNLPAGKYTFQVHAANEDLIWTPLPATFSFSIRKRFTETTFFLFSVFLLIIALFSGIFLWIIRRQKIRAALDRKIIESEQKALRAQINPHFVFNAMNSIQYFITENDKHNAGLFLSRFSKLMRRILDNSKKNWITLEDELVAIRHYLDLEKLRFGEKFTYLIEVEAQIDIYETEIPSMLTQPFLENAIWHGLMPKKDRGTLQLRFLMDGDDLVCEIEDDGIGREQASKIRKRRGHQSTGIQNVSERIELLNQLYNTHINLEIHNLMDEKQHPSGTLVRLRMKRPID